MNKPYYSGGQYSVFRFLFGAYLCIHFLHLLPYGTEVFSSAGVIASADFSPLMGLLPNPLSISDAPWVVSGLLLCGAVCGVLLALGYWHRIAALLAALILAWLFARNPLIANPSLPVVGWLLIAHLFVAPKPYGAWTSRPEDWNRWHMSDAVFIAAWVVLAVAYSYSGYTKLLSPSWLEGNTIAYVLQNPLAHDHFLREWLLTAPDWILQSLTWAVLYIELLFASLALFKKLRPMLWTLMLIVQFGFLLFLNFADLTFPMLLIHLLTFDRRWLPQWRKAPAAILFFDGYCAFCNGLVRFALAEDIEKRLTFAPLQGESAQQAGLAQYSDSTDYNTIVLIDADGQQCEKSTAAAQVLIMLGGLWQLCGYLILLIPRPLRDAGYDLIGRIRYRLGAQLPQVCTTIPLAYQSHMQY